VSHGSPAQRRWRVDLTAFGAGLLFSLGLAISGMTQPAKVLGFLDFLGDWDPTLMFVMGGAVVTYFFGYRYTLRKQKKPVYGTQFEIPSRRNIDTKLLIGSAIFGIGWGMAGYCPGPAIAGAGAMRAEALIFYVAMTIGMFVYSFTVRQGRKQ